MKSCLKRMKKQTDVDCSTQEGESEMGIKWQKKKGGVAVSKGDKRTPPDTTAGGARPRKKKKKESD